MSEVGRLGPLLVAVVATTAFAAGCSSDAKQATTTSRQELVYKTGLAEANRLGVCSTYKIDKMKTIVGGGRNFRALAPANIGKKGDAVVGERCAWERRGPGAKTRSLTVEARTYGDDTRALDDTYTSQRESTVGAEDVDGVGDAAYSSVSDGTTLLQVRSGSYFLSYSSRGGGGLDPVKLDLLKFMAITATDKLA